MRTVKVYLPSAERVQAFAEALLPLEGDFELVSGHYILDARSLMGIFSLDLSKPVGLNIYHDTKENLEAMAPFLAEGEFGV